MNDAAVISVKVARLHERARVKMVGVRIFFGAFRRCSLWEIYNLCAHCDELLMGLLKLNLNISIWSPSLPRIQFPPQRQ